MFVITATWYDDYNQPFLTEFFESSINEEAIFSNYMYQKSLYGKSTIASYPDTRVFSDGTRVILQLHKIKQTIEESSYETNGDVIELERLQIGEAS